ncbi:MAG: 2,3-bisphosphoglycerate-independent phosphoglycerate mutase [Verrucomicrobia bacterium]|nr:2,3-bisphosphoglycerate-independent phosphoglycerate mutase [Verrucomicrobiota bacterium]
MMPEHVLDSLLLDEGGSILLLVMDGLGDTATAETRWRTPLEVARTPHLDELVKTAACGRGIPVSPGITPGSGPGHLALFGYEPVAHEIGRGVLEAAGLDMEITSRDVCTRANFGTYDANGIITDRRAGRIPTEKCRELVAELARRIPVIEDVEFVLKAGKGHRFVVILRGDGLDGDLTDADPHHEGSPILEVKANKSEGQKAARMANEFIARANELLKSEHPANGIMMRGFSKTPVIRPFPQKWHISSAAIATYPMYRGITKLLGLNVLATGETIADEAATYVNDAAHYGYVFLHVKPTDAAGEDGNFDAKVAAIEETDAAIPALLKREPDVLCVTGDHSTPVTNKAHSWHPVPVMVRSRVCGADGFDRFTEKNCNSGSLGIFPMVELMPVLLANAGRIDKFGA